MKNIAFIIVLIAIIGACSTPKNSQASLSIPAGIKGDTIRIANDSLEYEVIIIDPGFNTWLNSIALPRGYYSQFYLENKNRFYVTEWNNRARQPLRFNPNLYEMTINYDPNINYGYEVNYLIYNYMIYFQNRYKQKLFGNVPIR
jgi:signal peptidase I